MSYKRGINKRNSALQNRRYLKLKMKTTETLYNYLNQKLPNAVNYDEFYNLFYALFCTLDILPENLRTLKIKKEVLAHTFAKLATVKTINNSSFEDIRNEEHWINQIRENMIKDKWPNIENAIIFLQKNS